MVAYIQALLLRGEDFGFNAWSVTEYNRDTEPSCWSSLSGFMQRFRRHSLRSCASQPLASGVLSNRLMTINYPTAFYTFASSYEEVAYASS